MTYTGITEIDILQELCLYLLNGIIIIVNMINFQKLSLMGLFYFQKFETLEALHETFGAIIAATYAKYIVY